MNLRVAGGPTDDPLYPHAKWPAEDKCNTQNEDEVYQYLTKFYGESNISFEHILIKEKADDLRIVQD